ncbi:MAG: DUF885 domain-containing protein [Pseudomonadota bacterium]
MMRTSTALAAIFALGACQLLSPADTTSTDAATEPAATPVATTAAAAAPKALDPAIEAESARLFAWFEAKFDEDVARSPMSQTFLGIKDDYDKWDDVSDANRRAELDIQRANVAELRLSFDFNSLDEQARLSWRLYEYDLEQAEAAFPFRYHNYTFNQMFGAQSRVPAFLVNQHQVTSKAEAEAYIARLKGVETYLGQHIENAIESSRQAIRPPRFVYDFVLNDARNVITGAPFPADPDAAAASAENEPGPSPLMGDFAAKVDALVQNGDITGAEADSLKAEAADALIAHVGPTFQRLITLMEAEQSIASTDDGAWKLPDGSAYYNTRLKRMTTTDMTADEIHDLGLAEVDRIHAEMREIMATVGFDGTLQDFFDFTRTDPQFFKPNTPEGKAEYLAEATAMIDIMREALPSQFNTFPKADMIVKAVEPFREKSAGKAFYQRPAPDGSRPGIYYANLYDMAQMPVYQMEALAYHEGIPGHHMQLAISQELQGIPRFRKFGGYTAYTEGWGLYSEYFPKEMGFYEDPYSDFGRLAMELWRAARLVVDTGLHDKQWTREEAIQYLIDNTPNPEGDCRKAIERYIVMPGQATAYKIGMNKIVDLRTHARTELGDQFDIREFHQTVLKNGPVPLAVLEEIVTDWITETQSNT